jgi:transcriptional regulator with XRE-family HTH domain
MPNLVSKFSLLPQSAQAIELLGQRIRLARIRRGLAVAELAVKAGINRNTLTALEQGKPGVSLGVIASVLWALGLDQSLSNVADPDLDLHGKALEAARRPKRAGKPRKVSDAYDF